MKLKYIPNILSAVRLMLVGVFVYTYFCTNKYIALAIFFLAGATDVIDGILARRFNWITNLGKILDPIADKSMQITVLICMSIDTLLPWWLPAFFVIKEIGNFAHLCVHAGCCYNRKTAAVSYTATGKYCISSVAYRCVFLNVSFGILFRGYRFTC